MRRRIQSIESKDKREPIGSRNQRPDKKNTKWGLKGNLEN